jgi:hypothetical protein
MADRLPPVGYLKVGCPLVDFEEAAKALSG